MVNPEMEYKAGFRYIWLLIGIIGIIGFIAECSRETIIIQKNVNDLNMEKILEDHNETLKGAEENPVFQQTFNYIIIVKGNFDINGYKSANPKIEILYWETGNIPDKTYYIFQNERPDSSDLKKYLS